MHTIEKLGEYLAHSWNWQALDSFHMKYYFVSTTISAKSSLSEKHSSCEVFIQDIITTNTSKATVNLTVNSDKSSKVVHGAVAWFEFQNHDKLN